MQADSEIVQWFLENACPDHHVRGGWDHIMASHTALNLLRKHPEIARANIITAIVCGELEEVKRILAVCPQAAVETTPADLARACGGREGDRFVKKLGPKGWDPLLFLCFTRLPLESVSRNAVAIARILLEHGAKPNAFFMAGGSRYTPLVGVIGEGEESRPAHPTRDDLVHLLLEHGAEPYDLQVVYNMHFRGEVLWFLEATYARSILLGRQADWADPEWAMLDMGNYGSGARWHLNIAVSNNDLKLAEWILSHGANPNSPPPRDQRLSQLTLHADALRKGFTEMADLLLRYGAIPAAISSDGVESFHAACLHQELAVARGILERHPEYLQAPDVMMHAARHDLIGVVEFLLDLGMSPNIADPKEGNQHPLHAAGSPRVAALLIERGAEIDFRESNYGGTALGFAIHGLNKPLIQFLSQHTRDVWNLTFSGNSARLREVLEARPELAKTSCDQSTPLMWLPADNEQALETAKILLSFGVDPTIRNQAGQTAGELASKRGLESAAELLRSSTED